MSFRLTATPAGITLGHFAHLATPHAVAGRTGGVSEGRFASLNLGPLSGDSRANIGANLARLRVALGFEGRPLLAPRQVHGAEVAVHRYGDPVPARCVFEGDGVITNDPTVALIVLAADCCALFLHDPRLGAIGVVHAGWRGTAGSIAAAAVAAMRSAFGSWPEDIRAGIGPAIGRCCYEVGMDVAGAVSAAAGSVAVFDASASGKAMLDLPLANRLQLQRAGLRPEKIGVAEVCTACRTDLFYSHRREGEPTGRFGALIAVAEGAKATG